MEELKTVNDNCKSHSYFNNIFVAALKNRSENSSEEYPKLRKPKPATLLKIQSHQKKVDSIEKTKLPSNTGDEKNVEVSLRQEFLNKKQQVEKATSNLLKKYEVCKSQGNLSNDVMLSPPSEEALCLHSLKLPAKEPDLFNPKSKNKTSLYSFNNFEKILVNIFYVKVQAHPSGFFAENLPHWYKRTFDKDLTKDWLEILERSNKFIIEKVQNKILLYTREDLLTNMDLNASADKDNMKKSAPKTDLAFKPKQRSLYTETSVRYKHLQKSLQGYTKNVDRDLSYADKIN